MNTSSSTDSPTYDSQVIRRWVILWNVISLGLLLYVSTRALLKAGFPSTTAALEIGFTIVYLLWYWAFIIRLPCWGRGSHWLALSFALILLGMAGMTYVDNIYYTLLLSQYGILFSVLVTRYAIPLTVLVSGLGAYMIITHNRIPMREAYGVIAGFGVAAFFSMLIGMFISAIIRQSYERQQIIHDLQAAREELARAERQAGILEERQRLAREIHDTLAQGFTSIVMHLEAADQALDPAQAAARQHLDRARTTARESLDEARRFVWALRSEPLERESLAQAIRRVAQRWSEESGIAAQVEVSGEERALPSPHQVTLLRTAQEGLANVRKHAGARQVNLTLTYMEDQVILDVQDDGLGFDPAQTHPDSNGSGFGLLGMRERAEQLGGSLIIESAPGEGVTLVVELPLPAPTLPEGL